VFHSPEYVGINLTISQLKPDMPPIAVAGLDRTLGFRYHSQTGKPEDFPTAGPSVLVYCDDPHLPRPTGPAIIDLAFERQHPMIIATDPDRLEVTLRRFLERSRGRIVWLDEGERYFEGPAPEFLEQRQSLCARLPTSGHSCDVKFIQAVLAA
jgi:hypothetical protein